MQQQLTLEQWLARPAAPAAPCHHQSLCNTRAVVPGGLACMDCGMLLLQHIPLPPEVLGYLSADWAWKYVYGRDWTTRDPGQERQALLSPD